MFCIEAFLFCLYYLLWGGAYDRTQKLMSEDILKGPVLSFDPVDSKKEAHQAWQQTPITNH